MNKLKKQRRMLGLTQHQLATRAKISPTRIAYSETGRLELTGAEISRVQDVFAMRAKELAGMVHAGTARSRAKSAVA